MEKHVYFVRHGQSESNAERIYRGGDSALTKKGAEQAQFVAERVSKIGVDALVASPFVRAWDTAAAIAERTGLAAEQSELFVETRTPSLVHGAHADEEGARKVMQEVHAGHDTPGYRHSDEENFDDMKTRAFEALAFLEAHPADRICVVTHGFFLRMLLTIMLVGQEASGKDFRHVVETFLTTNTGVTHVIFTDRHARGKSRTAWAVISWNDSAHLG